MSEKENKKSDEKNKKAVRKKRKNPLDDFKPTKKEVSDRDKREEKKVKDGISNKDSKKIDIMEDLFGFE